MPVAFLKLADMTHPPGFSPAEFATQKKTTRREKFLTRMEALIRWARLLAWIEPFYPKGERGRPPLGLERMLRVCFLQPWDGLAAEGVPDATMLLKFRRRLETHDRCKGLFTAIHAGLTARGLRLREGTMVDATLITAPSSTKNQDQQRDPEMH
jgi:IS5 family transposase